MIKKNMDETNKGFMKHLGGLELKQISDTQYEFIVEVKEMHLNTGKIAHGGFLSTIADTGMGTAAHKVAGNKRCVTINLDIKFISKINYLVEFLKILLKSKLTNESLSGTYESFNSKKFSNLKISNIIIELNDLRHDFYDVSSINETHVLNYFCSELKQSIRQQ